MSKKIKLTTIHFKDYPEFLPNLTPRQIFTLGAFGGTYWRPIYSPFKKKTYKNRYRKYNKEFWQNIPLNKLTLSSKEYDKNINYYKVKVGTSYSFWLSKGWINKDTAPYGFVEWYCGFYYGKRTNNDIVQIKRWQNIASNRGRFRLMLSRLIYKNNGKWNDDNLYPKLRQTLLHWCYILTKKDYMNDVKHLKEIGKIE